MDGTDSSAVNSAVSERPASSFSPARSSSLFLTGRERRTARSFKASMTAYSSLGMVKLSRTSLGFLAFTSLAGLGLGVTAGFLTGVTLLPSALTTLGVVVAGGVFLDLAAATGFAALTGSLSATAGVVAGAVVIRFSLNGINSLYRLKLRINQPARAAPTAFSARPPFPPATNALTAGMPGAIAKVSSG